jgi:hypothetical protein
LERLAPTAAERTVVAALGRARLCLTNHGFRVSGGPAFPSSPGQNSPDGELIVATGAGGAFIAFYSDPAKAQRLEPAIVRNAQRLGGQAERRSAVTVLWTRPPPSGLRNSVQACAFG